MTGTILVYRNDGRNPTAEVRLAGGDHIVLTLHAGGMLIEGFDTSGGRQVLFRGDVDTVARICQEMTSATMPRTSPLDRLLAIVVRFVSAVDVAAAFAAASVAGR